MKRFALAMLAALSMGSAFVPAALAHPGGHGLKMGEVVSVSGDTFELKTATETLTVKLSADTKFEKDTKAATRDLLKKGERVGVATTKTEAGGLVATRVVFGMKALAPPKQD